MGAGQRYRHCRAVRGALRRRYSGRPAVHYHRSFAGRRHVLARIVTDTALHDAREQARRAEDALARRAASSGARDSQRPAGSAARSAAPTARSGRDLETHASPLAEGVLFAPIVGHLDARRAEALTSRLLAEAARSAPELVILDIAGVSTIDTARGTRAAEYSSGATPAWLRRHNQRHLGRSRYDAGRPWILAWKMWPLPAARAKALASYF